MNFPQEEPSGLVIEEMKKVFIRACAIYHKHINFPSFDLKEVP